MSYVELVQRKLVNAPEDKRRRLLHKARMLDAGTSLYTTSSVQRDTIWQEDGTRVYRDLRAAFLSENAFYAETHAPDRIEAFVMDSDKTIFFVAVLKEGVKIKNHYQVLSRRDVEHWKVVRPE